jgi:hypothetical protein
LSKHRIEEPEKPSKGLESKSLVAVGRLHAEKTSVSNGIRIERQSFTMLLRTSAELAELGK